MFRAEFVTPTESPRTDRSASKSPHEGVAKHRRHSLTRSDKGSPPRRGHSPSSKRTAAQSGDSDESESDVKLADSSASKKATKRQPSTQPDESVAITVTTPEEIEAKVGEPSASGEADGRELVKSKPDALESAEADSKPSESGSKPTESESKHAESDTKLAEKSAAGTSKKVSAPVNAFAQRRASSIAEKKSRAMSLSTVSLEPDLQVIVSRSSSKHTPSTLNIPEEDESLKQVSSTDSEAPTPLQKLTMKDTGDKLNLKQISSRIVKRLDVMKHVKKR